MWHNSLAYILMRESPLTTNFLYRFYSEKMFVSFSHSFLSHSFDGNVTFSTIENYVKHSTLTLPHVNHEFKFFPLNRCCRFLFIDSSRERIIHAEIFERFCAQFFFPIWTWIFICVQYKSGRQCNFFFSS